MCTDTKNPCNKIRNINLEIKHIIRFIKTYRQGKLMILKDEMNKTTVLLNFIIFKSTQSFSTVKMSAIVLNLESLISSGINS